MNNDESAGMQEETTGHLSTLIARVHDEEVSLGYARKESLVDIAEFVLSWPSRCSREEYDEAIKTLAMFHLAHLASRRHGRKWIRAELTKRYQGRCARCGKPLSNLLSLQFGHGPICRRRLGLSTSRLGELREVRHC